MSDEKKKNYRDTLNLPKTRFAMKANLVQREPQMRKRWAERGIYAKIREARAGAKPYILHDGPPYANGDIHMGHVINKVLKDFVVKYKTMTGHDAPYIPGWDCHGLPIEAKVVADLGEKAREMPKHAIRRDCMKYASKYVKLQGRQFQDLGVFGDFGDPYLTFKPQYEAGILEVFAELVGKGLVYKQLKPIHWSIGCETALAEAELEYKDIASPSIFVNFPAAHETITRLIELGLVTGEQARDAAVCFMIWTTTPWTLAANLAVAVHPRLEYTTLSYEKDGRKYVSVVSTDRLEAVVAAGGLEEGQYRVAEKAVRGSELESLRYRHPFVENNPTDKDAYMVIPAEYVTTEDGTGLVHTAPGHGLEDYMSGQKYGRRGRRPLRRHRTRMAAGQKRARSRQRRQRLAARAWLALLARRNPAQLPPLLAQQGPRHLPRDRAVVHQCGPGAARRRQEPSRTGDEQRRDGALDPRLGPEAHRRHVGIAPGLVHQPPAKLGPAHHSSLFHARRTHAVDERVGAGRGQTRRRARVGQLVPTHAA